MRARIPGAQHSSRLYLNSPLLLSIDPAKKFTRLRCGRESPEPNTSSRLYLNSPLLLSIDPAKKFTRLRCGRESPEPNTPAAFYLNTRFLSIEPPRDSPVCGAGKSLGSKGLVSADRSEAAALLGTTPRSIPKSSASDLASLSNGGVESARGSRPQA